MWNKNRMFLLNFVALIEKLSRLFCFSFSLLLWADVAVELGRGALEVRNGEAVGNSNEFFS